MVKDEAAGVSADPTVDGAWEKFSGAVKNALEAVIPKNP